MVLSNSDLYIDDNMVGCLHFLLNKNLPPFLDKELNYMADIPKLNDTEILIIIYK